MGCPSCFRYLHLRRLRGHCYRRRHPRPACGADMVSSLVVVFTCIEMLILPFVAQQFLSTEPLVAGAWMGLAVKSNGGAIAIGASTVFLIMAKMSGQGIICERSQS